MRKSLLVVLAWGAACSLLIPSPVAGGALRVDLTAEPAHLEWAAAHEGTIDLEVTAPDGEATARWSFEGSPALGLGDLEAAFGRLEDGSYAWRVQGRVVLDPATRADLEARRTAGENAPAWLEAAAGGLRRSGSFRVEGGRFVPSVEEGEPAARAVTGLDHLGVRAPGGLDEQTINGDLVVHNSLCVGFDCVEPENFGADTIRLKENNLRIHFDDTSAGAFPSRDWRIEANSDQGGGGDFLRVVDVTAGRAPFTVEAAPADTLVVDSTGRVGVGTASPVLQVHARRGDSPGVRLEQDTSSGFAAQSWDVVGNETSFFVRDATNGSTLPFRIRPGAASNSLIVDTDGDVGVGILTPTAPLHVSRTDTAQVLVQNTTATAANRTLLVLRNAGQVTSQFVNTTGETWNLVNLGNGFAVSRSGSGVNEMLIANNGNVTITGTLTQNSNRETKTAVKAVDPQMVLDRLLELPIATWQRKGEDGVTHLGPMAQDFRALFGLGADDTSIATVDMAGVTMAAVQALHERNRELRERSESLERENAELRDRQAGLDARLATLEELVSGGGAPAAR
jgi:hypothetical protein